MKPIIQFALPTLLISSIAVATPAPVVGGTTVPLGAWPDVVAVLAPDGACTGTLIAPDLVLTAGHCAAINPNVVIVNTIDYGQSGGEVIHVKSSRAYPKWEETYDVGIVVLEHAAHAKPRAVARACHGKALANGTVRIVGFGLTDTAGTGDNTRLHQASTAVDDPRCKEAPGCNAAIAPDGEFTAGGHGTDSCFGDSGGPAFVQTTAGAALIGVVSRGMSVSGRPCGNGGIYVRADKVVPWIEKVTGHRVTRSPCDQPADGDDELAAEPAGGCNAGGGALELGVMLVSGLVWRRRRRAKA